MPDANADQQNAAVELTEELLRKLETKLLGVSEAALERRDFWERVRSLPEVEK